MRSDAPGLARETRPPAIVPSVDSHAAQRRAESSWHYACAQPHYTHVSLVIAAQGTECERLNEWVMVVQAIRPQTCARSDSPNDVKSLNPGHDIQIGRENSPLAKRMLVTSLNRQSLSGFVDPGTQRVGINADNRHGELCAQRPLCPDLGLHRIFAYSPHTPVVYSIELVQSCVSEHRSASNRRAMMEACWNSSHQTQESS
ncbi:hypothetical protein MRS44_007793 [Fusarium solani]|uniref:uncharacterized protein n=1 Tax=Fusarium solani TaxID=169388 RepID=UPI0032C4A10A|nr:hypothetical protein MRS44_007793 [Fusarium solani]